MTLRLAVFDMVGTTVEAGEEVPEAFRAAFRPLGVTLTDARIDGARGRSKREAISLILAEEGRADDVDRVHAHFREALQEAYRVRARAIPGAEQTLRSLVEQGVACVLVTGLDRDTADLLLSALGWHALPILGVVTGDDVARGRPAPDLVLAAMARAGVDDPREVAVVGDTTADLEAAAAAGVACAVGVLTGAHDRAALAARPHAALLGSVAEVTGWLARHEDATTVRT